MAVTMNMAFFRKKLLENQRPWKKRKKNESCRDFFVAITCGR